MVVIVTADLYLVLATGLALCFLPALPTIRRRH
jgi:hypothetical protein